MAKTFTPPPGWRRVIFSADCEPYGYCPECSEIEGEPVDYAECPCPGPTQEDEFDYIEIQGVLYAREKTATLPADQTGSRKDQTGKDIP